MRTERRTTNDGGRCNLDAASLRRQFSDDGIDTRALLTASDTPTGTALIYVAEDGENCIAVAPGANRLLGPEAIDALTDRIAGADYLLLQLEIPMESVARAIEKAAEVGTRVILNPAQLTRPPTNCCARST